MWKIVWGLAAVVLALAWAGSAAAADVELVKVGNDPQNVWCDTGARQLAQGATLNVQIQGRSKSDTQVTGKIRMKSQTDKFEWAIGEPTVTFTRTGSNPTSFGVKAKSTAPVGTYSIAFAAVDARNKESSSKSCSIEVIPPPATGGGPRVLPGGLGSSQPVNVSLTVSPPSGATSGTAVTLRAVASGGGPEIGLPRLGLETPSDQCLYRAIPTSGGTERRQDQWDVGCVGWTTGLSPGTYTLQVTYRKMSGRLSADYNAQITNYVVAPAPVLNLPGTTPQQLAQTFSLKLGVAPASGQATSDTPLTMRLLKEGTWNPPSVTCTFAAIPTGSGNPWSVGPDSTCAVPSPILVAGTYTIRLSYRYQKPDGSPGDGSSELANYVVTPAPRVEVVSLSLDPLQPVAGQQATVKMTIKNGGAGPLPRVSWTIVKNGVGLRNGVQQNVPAGNTPGNPFEVTASFTAEAGSLGIAGYVDYANELREPPSERANNVRTLDVMVAVPPLPRPVILSVKEFLLGPESRVAPGWYAVVAVCNVAPDANYVLWRSYSGIARNARLSGQTGSARVQDCPSGHGLSLQDFVAPPGGCAVTYTYEFEETKGQLSARTAPVDFTHPGPALSTCTPE